MKQPYNTALYMRLSKDDESYGDSTSIETQRIILHQFANNNGLHIVDEYIDDGWSGTNFERPSFKRMMSDVESSKINCIVTKDLSRFGREHVMMGYYFDFVFPENQIRYIAVAENEDTEKGLSDFVPFKNLFNEWYAKDTSRKVKAALHAKFTAGEHVCTYAPIGYKKHSEIKNRLEIDKETSWIIEKIFNLAYHGAGAAKITRTLVEEKIPTPGWYNYTRYGKFSHIYEDAPEEKKYSWVISQVKSILHDEVYIGNSIHGKQTNISFKNQKKIRHPKEDWYRIENTHDAIISKDMFDHVQAQITNRRRKQKDGVTQIFSGLIRCADCGWSMSFATNNQGSKPYSYFNCTSYRQLGKINSSCSSHYLRYDTLYAYVLSRIQYWSCQAQIDSNQLLTKLLKVGDQSQNCLIENHTAEISKAQKRLSEIERQFAKLYEDWAKERITEYNFTLLSQKFQEEQEKLNAKIAFISAELSSEQQRVSNTEKWLELIKKYAQPTELTSELLNALIEKIVVHEAIKDADGTSTQEIEIYYRFLGKID